MKRLTNAAVTLVVTLVAYQLYALAVVPWLEPPLALRAASPATDADWQGGAHAVGRYQQMLRSYLPAGHWALSGSPQVYEYGPMVFVLDDYRAISGGRVELTKCVLVAFPTPRVPGQPPPRDAVIVEPPPGATIQFDEFDESPDLARSRIGRPVAGVFPGELVIRSDMREPGPQDDLRIVTRDLRFNQAMLSTQAEVDLRLGPHRGRGRVLEIRLLKEPHGGADKPLVAGVAALEVREDVRALIDVTGIDASGIDVLGAPAPQRVTQAGGWPAAGRGVDTAWGDAARVRPVAATSAPNGPLEIVSAGPFRFDFTRFVASFHDEVQATLGAGGARADRLRCRELLLHFATGDGGTALIRPEDEPELARRQGRTLAGMRPHQIEAVGSPVRVDSPARQAAVRGERLRLWLDERRLRVEGAPNRPASVALGRSEARASAIDYAMPPEQGGRTVGALACTGPGWIVMAPEADRPDRLYRARWGAVADGGAAVTLDRDRAGNPVLKLRGRPEVAAAGLGKLTADQIVARMSEVAPDGPQGPAIELGEGAILPRRVDALGTVEFTGQQVEGRSESLVAAFRTAKPEPTDGGASPAGRRDGGWADGSDDAPGRYRLATRAIQVDVGLAGGRAKPLSVLCSGGVRLEESPRFASEDPLSVLGQELRIDRLDRRGAARLTIAGGDGKKPPPGERGSLAEIRSRGLRVWVRDLHFDQAAGRAWTEGRGDAVFRLPRAGALGPLGGEATLRWRGGMEFDGAVLAVSDEVFAEATGGWVHCERLAARLNRPIDFVGGAPGGDIDVESIECSGGVTVDYRSTDEEGQRSHEHATLRSIAVSQKSGRITGQGPGSLRSVHLASGAGPLDPSAGAPATVPDANDRGLKFLRVDFLDALAGNYHDRAIRFRGDVKTVYGPVIAWEQQLPLFSPEGVPTDAVQLRCDELRVHEDPASVVARGPKGGPFGPVELQAAGRVGIEATVGDRGGAVVAEAAAASYSAAADRFLLEGDGSGPAKLWARSSRDQPFAYSPAQRLVHHRGSGATRTKITGLGGVEYRPQDRAAAPAARLR